MNQPDGAVRVVTFYARTEDEALKLARAWAKRTGHKIELEGEDAAA